MRKTVKYLLLAASLGALVSCAAAEPPFASPDELAIKRQLSEELAQYPGLRITVAGNRVYLEGEVLNKTELDHAIGVAKAARGVNSVMDNVYLIEVGSNGGDDDRH